MNLKLCVEDDENLYHQMSVRFSKIAGISLDDCWLVLRLTTEAKKRLLIVKRTLQLLVVLCSIGLILSTELN